MIARSTIDRLTITALMMTAIMPFAALSPAKAATVAGSGDCAAQVEAVQASAASADPKAAAKALRTARLAEKLCAEGNRFDANRKFAQAREQLTATVQLAAQH